MHHDNCIAFFRHDPVTKSNVHGKCNNLPLREEAVGRWRKNYRRADPDYYTIGEAAEKFGIPRATIYRWVKSGKVYSERIDTMLLLPRKSFDLWVKKNVRGKGAWIMAAIVKRVKTYYVVYLYTNEHEFLAGLGL